MAGSAQLIVLTGPTACGKTEVGLRLARDWPVEVISADSMQVYRGMDIATAKPEADEQAKLPHHLIDILEPDQEYSAGAFARDASLAEAAITARGAKPLVLGGTGLYVKALVYGLGSLPERQSALRAWLEAFCRAQGTQPLWNWLERLDSAAAARVSPNDPVRIVRYLEIIFSTGRSVTSQHAGFGERQRPATIIAIMPEREVLYERINRRAALMFESGLIQETERLLQSGCSPDLRSMQTLAYKHVVRMLAGQISEAEALSAVQIDTRHYAKRQLTWLKSNRPDVVCATPEEAYEAIASRYAI